MKRKQTWSDRLIDWYSKVGRDLPWRRANDTYAVWVSEIMLQQTQVNVVVPYYHAWMKRFPTVEALASASEEEVNAHWQGLGYYRRGRNLWAGAKVVVRDGWPTSRAEWLKMPGVGEYTASAMASITLGEPTAVVDGNVERVFARMCASELTGSARTRAARTWAQANIDSKRPAAWNQAIMELGATVCSRHRPDCSQCPVRSDCRAAELGESARYPRPSPKPVSVSREFVVAAVCCRGAFGFRKVEEGDWWAGLWEFPRAAMLEALQTEIGPAVWTRLGAFRHTVTHHRLTFHAHLVEVDTLGPDLRWVRDGEFEGIPLPAPQRAILSAARARISSAKGSEEIG